MVDETRKDTEGAQETSGEGGGRGAEKKRSGDAPLPEINFSTFVVSLNNSALMHMGEIPDPTTGEVRKDVALARHAIDTLAMLGKKTEGNLTEEEKGLLDHLLYDLRLKFLKVSSG